MRLRSALVSLLGLFLASCASRREQLEQVAKDWCETIRASQVMPVYPLTQDLQPGDVFLVTTPIDQQHKEWRKRGYLPLSHHVGRIAPTGYGDFYNWSFAPKDGRPLAPKAAGSESTLTPKAEPGLLVAPLRVGFPSYSFSVSQSSQLAAALPISGIPVGLGLLGTSSASGSVDLEDVWTLGIDELSLSAALESWYATRRTLFVPYASASIDGRPVAYLRVVSRIFVVGGVKVTLSDTSARSMGLDVGLPQSVSGLLAKAPENREENAAQTVENHQNALAKVNESLEGAKGTGGSLRLAAASARTVVMDETFEPPIAVGYLGFDRALYADGTLGPALATIQVVESAQGAALFEQFPIAHAFAAASAVQAYQALRAVQENSTAARQAVAELDALARFAPAAGATRREFARGLDGNASERDWNDDGATGYARFLAWRGSLESSATTLRGLLAREFAFTQGETSAQVEPGSALAQQLQATLAQLEAELAEAEVERAHAPARRRAVAALASLLGS